MKKAWIVLSLLIALLWISIASAPPLANKGHKGLEASTIDEVFSLPEKEIDVGTGALLIAKEFDPMLDVTKYVSELDRMALELRSRIGDQKDPERIIALMNDYIFGERGYGYPDEDKDGAGVSFLHVLLDGKQGNCVALSTLYLALAERIGLPTFGVIVPTHMFVRYDTGVVRINVEPTYKGLVVPDTEYIEEYDVPETSDGKVFHMRNMTKREVLGILLYNLGCDYVRQGGLNDTIQTWEKASAVNPDSKGLWVSLGEAYAHEERLDEAIEAYKKALQIEPRNSEVWDSLGDVYTEGKKYTEAISAYKRALEVNQDAIYAFYSWYALAQVYSEQHKYDEAIEAYKRSLDILPREEDAQSEFGPDCHKQEGLAKAWSVLAGAYYEAEGCEVDRVVSACSKVMEADPDLSHLKQSLAFTYYLDGNHTLAGALDPDIVVRLSDEEVFDDESLTNLFAVPLVIYVCGYLVFALFAVRIHRRRKMTLSQAPATAANAGQLVGSVPLYVLAANSSRFRSADPLEGS
ncbi:tetratricopeptide repeat protein [bacterium]|nr:tetratricopeptide repeat protein [bacterium]